MAAPVCPLCEAPETAAFALAEGRLYHRCRACRLTFLAPEQLPDRRTELAIYLLHENDPGDPRYRAFLSQLTEPLLRNLFPGMVGLDFGCGPGPAIGPMLARHGLEVIDYDPFFRTCRAALERCYDFITCSETAEHFHVPGREFRLLDGLLRPGGWLGVMTTMLEDDARFAGWWYRRDPTHVCFYRRETMDWIAASFGWSAAFPAPNVVLFRKPPYS